MRLLFLDESGDPGMGGTSHFVLGGVIVRADQWGTLNKQLDALKQKRGFSPALEIKWRHIRNRGGRNNPLNAFSDADRIQFGKDVLAIVRNSASSRVLGVVIDKVHAYSRPEVTSAEDIYERAVTFMLERFQYYLNAIDDFGIVV